MALKEVDSLNLGMARCCGADYFDDVGEITFHSLGAVKTLRAARFALGAESFAFGRTLNVRISLPLGASLDSGRFGVGAEGGRFLKSGGGREIRTLGELSPSSVFKTGAFNHSATPPQRGVILLENHFQSTTYWQ